MVPRRYRGIGDWRGGHGSSDAVDVNDGICMLGSGSFAYRGAKKKAPHRLSLDVKDAFKNLAEGSGETEH